MQMLQSWIQQANLLGSSLSWKIAASLAVILILWLLFRLALSVVHLRIDDARQLYTWRKTLSLLGVGLGALVLGWLWLPVLQSWATFFGLISAGIVIALQGPITNLAGWIFIVWRRPFVAGDRIELGPDKGDVIDIGLFQFTLLEIGNWVEADQSTGRIMHLPNGLLFTQSLSNYTKGFTYIWNEVPVLITFESDWQKTKEILGEIGREHAEHLSTTAANEVRQAARRFMIYYPTLTPTVYTAVEDSGVRLTIRYLCEPRRRRTSEQAIWEAILLAFGEHLDIEFAYPTQRIYARWVEDEQPTTGSKL